jgi:catechol 2,3-dioxygenase-like lactoylglutathione lyase family enzyme
LLGLKELRRRVFSEAFVAERNDLYQLEKNMANAITLCTAEGLELLTLFEWAEQRQAEPVVWNRPGISHIAFKVGDVDAVYERLRAAGANIRTPVRTLPSGIRLMVVHDPDGTLIELAEQD